MMVKNSAALLKVIFVINIYRGIMFLDFYVPFHI